jgi:hypothetical protein
VTRISRCIPAVLCAILMVALARAQQAKPETKEQKIARAMSAAPENVSKEAAIIDRDDNGAETVLREGTNGFTCFPGHPGVVGDLTYCANAVALRWESDFMALKAKPTTTEPGIEYVLLGGTDWSPSDPNATSGTPFKEPPHLRILWPFDAKTTGFPTEPKQTGTWIMWAGTPWAHLMINQKP